MSDRELADAVREAMAGAVPSAWAAVRLRGQGWRIYRARGAQEQGQ